MQMYDFVVVGAGSGGLAAARRAASHLNTTKDGCNAKVAVVDRGHLGGTCVNAGCVPKKLLWNSANMADSLKLYEHYGFEGVSKYKSDNGADKLDAKFNWESNKNHRNEYLDRLRSIYAGLLKKENIDFIRGTVVDINKVDGPSAFFSVTIQSGPHAAGQTIELCSRKILLATGMNGCLS